LREGRKGLAAETGKILRRCTLRRFRERLDAYPSTPWVLFLVKKNARTFGGQVKEEVH
jgi:hypothetical protein